MFIFPVIVFSYLKNPRKPKQNGVIKNNFRGKKTVKQNCEHLCDLWLGKDLLNRSYRIEMIGKQPLLDMPLCCREEIMVMLKISSFLAVYALVVCQMDSFQAAPVR